MLDNTIDVSGFPTEAQGREVFAKQRIGLSTTGLAAELIMCVLSYDSPEAAAAACHWAKCR